MFQVCEELFVTPCAFYNHNCASKANIKSSSKRNSNITWCIFCARLENLPKESSPTRINSSKEMPIQHNDADDSSDLQITNVCSLSSVLNMYVSPVSTANNLPIPAKNVVGTNSITQARPAQAQYKSNTENSKHKNKKTNSLTPTLNSALNSSLSSSLSASNDTMDGNLSNNVVNKPSESVVLKIANLNSSSPYVSSVTTTSKSNRPDSIPLKGRLKIKNVKELMAVPPGNLCATTKEAESSLQLSKNSHLNDEAYQVSSQNISQLCISDPYSIIEPNIINTNQNKKTKFPIEDTSERLADNEVKRTHLISNNDDEDADENCDTTETKVDLSESTNEIPQNGYNSIRTDESMKNKEKSKIEIFDKDDSYVCMGCQPLKLLDGLALTNHCINNPTHLQIKHLADFNKCQIVLHKLNKNTVNTYRRTNAIQHHPSLARQSSVSSISSNSENGSGSSYMRRPRKNRNAGNAKYFESSDTGTDGDEPSLDIEKDINQQKKILLNYKNHK